MVEQPLSRTMWRALEPVHTVTYFASESQAACTALGTKGFWMSYFALRAAPLGAVPPEVVAALFYNFSPRMVARAVPDVWRVAAPERYLEVRLDTVDAALRRTVGAELLASDVVVEASEIAKEAALAASTAGRALAAANVALDWPDAPHLVLWHAQTVLREHRGDGHVAALLTAGLDPTETLVLFAADNAFDATWLRERRGWTEQEWTAAADRLVERGLLQPRAGTPTPEGHALRSEVEARTDALAEGPWAAVGADRAERLVELVTPLVSAVVTGDGTFMAPNPMGLRPLARVGE
jgi:DNA-binding MarR family transcriptional regulator